MRPSPALLVLALVACSKPATSPEPESTPEPTPPGRPMIEAMHANLDGVAQAHLAVARGDLPGARAAMAGVSSQPRIEGLPTQWMEHQVALRVRAAEVAEATDATAAAAAVTDVARACGDCHAFVGVGPSFWSAPPPTDDTDLAGHMRHHAWATDLMWKGIVAGDEGLYDRGALALGEADLGQGSQPDTLGESARAVHQVAAAGLAADAPQGRATAYATILAGCAGCHEAAQVTPDLPYEHRLE